MHVIIGNTTHITSHSPMSSATGCLRPAHPSWSSRRRRQNCNALRRHCRSAGGSACPCRSPHESLWPTWLVKSVGMKPNQSISYWGSSYSVNCSNFLGESARKQTGHTFFSHTHTQLQTSMLTSMRATGFRVCVYEYRVCVCGCVSAHSSIQWKFRVQSHPA